MRRSGRRSGRTRLRYAMRARPWHEAQTCVYTWWPRRTEAASYDDMNPLKSQDWCGAWMTSEACTVDTDATATAVPAATAGASSDD